MVWTNFEERQHYGKPYASVHIATRRRKEDAFTKYWCSKFLIAAKTRVPKLHAKSTDWQIFFFCFCGANAQFRPKPPHCEVSISHTIRHTHVHTYISGGTPLNEWSVRRRGRYLHNTHKKRRTAMPSAGIKPADLRLRPRDHQDMIAKLLLQAHLISCCSCACTFGLHRITYVTEMKLTFTYWV